MSPSADDYTNSLNEEAKSYLHRVRQASKRMEQLIDHMLRLSHVTLNEIRRAQVDLSALARLRFTIVAIAGNFCDIDGEIIQSEYVVAK